MCPLKEAAKDAPDAPAWISPEKTYTYQELDAWADSISSPSSTLRMTGPELVAHLFGALRKGRPALIPHLRHPPCAPPLPERPSIWLMTSGSSTGVPKIAELSLAAFLASAEAVSNATQFTHGGRWHLSLPLYHVGGLSIIFRALTQRAAVTTIPSDPLATHASCVPTQLYRGLSFSNRLRCLLVGGALLPPTLSSPFPMWHTYGMTETASAIWLQNREGGTLLSHAQLKIGEEGEIYVRGASLFSGYLGAPHPPGEWFATGDIGAFDAGRLTLIGRKDRRFTSGGEKIYPERIEAALCALPEIEAAAVVPYPDPEFGMRPAACILWRKPPLSLSALKERLTPLLPRYQHPTLLLTLPALPLLPSGKIDYQKISPIVADFLRSQSLSL